MKLFDEIGYWSVLKHEIIRRYATEYTRILKKQGAFHISYIEGFSSSGLHLLKDTGEPIYGSPIHAVKLEPSFDDFHFVELDDDKLSSLKVVMDQDDLRQGRKHFYHGDCNNELVEKIFPLIRYDRYQRALCILDPYGLDLDWAVVETAGKNGAIEMFLNFPVMDMNRNALWHNPDAVPEWGRKRMTRFWGDESWRKIAYTTEPTLFGDQDVKLTNEHVVNGYVDRLRKVADFAYVPDPIPMRNQHGATIYYLIFASQKPVAAKIVKHIFQKFRTRLR